MCLFFGSERAVLIRLMLPKVLVSPWQFPTILFDFRAWWGRSFSQTQALSSRHDFKKFAVSSLSVLCNLDDTGTGVQLLLKKFKRLCEDPPARRWKEERATFRKE